MVMTKNKRWKSHKGHFTHAHSSFRKADDSAQKDYDQLIHSQKLIIDNYDRNDEDDDE